jgi:hypothetical protein
MTFLFKIYGRGGPDNASILIYKGMIDKITVTQKFHDEYTHEEIKFIDIGNGLVLIGDDNRTEEYYFLQLCYNLNNRNTFLELLRVKIPQEGDIKYYENSIEIYTQVNMSYISGSGSRITRNMKVSLFFEQNGKKLSSYKLDFNYDPSIYAEPVGVTIYDKEFELVYDNSGRLKEIYVVYEWGKILRKILYYDGQLRYLPTPYLLEREGEILDLEEIIIFENENLKYDVKCIYHGPPLEPGVELRFRSNYFFHHTIFEYDEYGNEIKHSQITDSETFWSNSFVTEYFNYDGIGNWMHCRRYPPESDLENAKMYKDLSWEINEIDREIKYK